VSDAARPNPLRLVATLSAAGLAAGLVLVGVYLPTKPLIDHHRAEAMKAAVLRVLPGTESVAALVSRDGSLVPHEEPSAVVATGEGVFAGFTGAGDLVGYAVPAAGPGYMDTVALIYGFDVERRTVLGMQVLESRETPGLGDKIIHDEAFHANFGALEVEPEIVPVKRGAKVRPNEVDCITGATISSEAVVSIINGSWQEWLPRLEQHRAAGDGDQDGPGS
jgi:electron transport complex protein RnfG